MKHEYEMTADDHVAILAACKPTPVMYLSGGLPMHSSQQENANEAWRRLGLKMGFDPMTVEPVSGKSTTFFRADAAADPLIPDEPIAQDGVTDEMVARALQGFDTGVGDPNDYRKRMRAALIAALGETP